MRFVKYMNHVERSLEQNFMPLTWAQFQKLAKRLEQ